MSEEILDVQMPPPPPEPEPELQAEEPEMVVEEEDPPSASEAEEPRELMDDDEVFKDVPVVKKVKRKCSAKQLEHLAKCREKALAKKKKDKEYIQSQKAKQKRIVEEERRRNPPKPKRKYVRKQVEAPVEEEYHYGQSGQYEDEDFPYEDVPQDNTYRGQEHPEVFHKLTASEIRAIQRDAISDYEVVRKDRKHKKRLEEEQVRVEQERRRVMGMMSGKPQEDHWGTAFNFN